MVDVGLLLSLSIQKKNKPNICRSTKKLNPAPVAGLQLSLSMYVCAPGSMCPCKCLSVPVSVSVFVSVSLLASVYNVYNFSLYPCLSACKQSLKISALVYYYTLSLFRDNEADLAVSAELIQPQKRVWASNRRLISNERRDNGNPNAIQLNNKKTNSIWACDRLFRLTTTTPGWLYAS